MSKRCRRVRPVCLKTRNEVWIIYIYISYIIDRSDPSCICTIFSLFVLKKHMLGFAQIIGGGDLGGDLPVSV